MKINKFMFYRKKDLQFLLKNNGFILVCQGSRVTSFEDFQAKLYHSLLMQRLFTKLEVTEKLLGDSFTFYLTR